MNARNSQPKKKVTTTPRPARKLEAPSRLKGFKDIIPEEWRYFRLVADKALQLAKIYDFERYETPIIEPLSLFERSLGKQSDIVTRQLYTFIDPDGDKVALRPQLRPSLARTVIEHNLLVEETKFVKMCAFGPVFRCDRIQSGLWRQHTQWALDIINNPSPIADALIIMIGYNFFKELQLDIRVDINSLGDAECRAAYSAKLVEYYKEHSKKLKLPVELKKILSKKPIEALLSNDERLTELNQDAPAIVDFLSEEAKNHFFTVIEHLDAFGVPYNLNHKLFGAADYYGRTVFEFIAPEEEGRKEAVLGSGGRYDNLFERLFGKPTSAVGFAVGIEKTVSRIRSLEMPLEESSAEIYLAQLGDAPRQKALALFEELRKAGFKVSQGFLHNALKHQLEEAQKMNVRYTLVLGQKELMDGTIIIRDMESGAQEVVDAKKIIHELEKRLGAK